MYEMCKTDCGTKAVRLILVSAALMGASSSSVMA
jgi:hypothetical protein